MRRNLRFAIGSAVIVAAIAYLMIAGIRETSSYYLTVPELVAKKTEYGGSSLRLAGRVAPGTIGWDAKTLRLDFALGSFPNAQTVGETVPVSFTGIKPDMFADGRDVIVEGRYEGGVIQAKQVLTSCPSKYEAKTAEAKADGKGGPG